MKKSLRSTARGASFHTKHASNAIVVRVVFIIIIISAERRSLLDICLPQSSPRRSVQCCPHPAASRDLPQIVGPPCGGPTNTASPGTWSPFEDLSAPTAVSPPHNAPCPLPLEVCNSSTMSVTLVLLRISTFLIRSRRETPMRSSITPRLVRSACDRGK
jgi:hypothetical protein